MAWEVLQAGGRRFNPCSAYQSNWDCGMRIGEFESEIYNLRSEIV